MSAASNVRSKLSSRVLHGEGYHTVEVVAYALIGVILTST